MYNLLNTTGPTTSGIDTSDIDTFNPHNAITNTLFAALFKTLAFVTKTMLAAIMTLLLFIIMYQLIKTDDFPATAIPNNAIPPIIMHKEEITVFDNEELPPQAAILEPPERMTVITELDPNNTHTIIPTTFKWQETKTTLLKPSRNEAMPIFRVDPVYPDRLLNRGIEGFVDLLFDVNEIGATKNVQVIGAEPPNLFNRSAIKAVSRWKYEPRVVDGQSVYQSSLTTRIRFTIAKKS